jgi:hypothetical protein
MERELYHTPKGLLVHWIDVGHSVTLIDILMSLLLNSKKCDIMAFYLITKFSSILCLSMLFLIFLFLLVCLPCLACMYFSCINVVEVFGWGKEIIHWKLVLDFDLNFKICWC